MFLCELDGVLMVEPWQPMGSPAPVRYCSLIKTTRITRAMDTGRRPKLIRIYDNTFTPSRPNVYYCTEYQDDRLLGSGQRVSAPFN